MIPPRLGKDDPEREVAVDMEGIKVIVRLVKREGVVIKTRFDSLFERVSIHELHVEWKEVGESLLLIILSLLLYGSVIFTQFSFIPIMIITIKRGWKESAVYLTGALILLLYMMVNNIWFMPVDNSLMLFSPIHFTFEYIGRAFGIRGARFLDYYFLFGVLGIFLGYLVSKNYRLSYVIFKSLLVYVGIVLFTLGLSGLAGGFKTFVSDYSLYIENKTDSYVSHYLSQIGDHRQTLSTRGINYHAIEEKAEQAAQIYKRNIVFDIAPKGGYLIKQLILMFLSILFVKHYFRKRLDRAAFSFDLKRYQIDDDWVWGLVSAWGLVYINLFINSSFLGILSWNLAVILSFLFFLRGLSVLMTGADKLRAPHLLQYLVFAFLLFYSFVYFVTAVTGIGVMDIWLKLREHIQDIKRREGV